ncbi:peptide-methionine (S)-S-oxide reductase MsrA [Salinicoccus sp. RF5]|uniref:peptide-methionine (S)-S-oxide reductase MsrA n=1 Tax=Salinicoccus sp. RF5 TaxID=2748874 RepID=UPI001E5200DA|nr:peptide-methionine (S)-S-oxide reductase MsrA [Salinicoccus sp. RF5]MCC4723398.1 peptide-methionine (S)-S-oxide reductase MsrA [Salinicoccus sp. RF5]
MTVQNHQHHQLPELEAGLASLPCETATFGMGCFWGPDARFGALAGVLRTRTGYAGGTTENPTYKEMGDHTETIEVDFDPSIISYEETLRHFWRSHYPNRDAYRGRQYISLLRFHDEKQEAAVERIKGEMEAELGFSIETEIAPFEGFTLAEERHQKYYLKRYPGALNQLECMAPEPSILTDSIFAARLNGFVKGFGNREALLEEISGWPIRPEAREQLKEKLKHMKW